MKYRKRLIEIDVPIARISAHARREKSIRHGHIATLHIWLARLTIRPEHPVLKPGEQASFTCTGQDQYGQPYGIPPVEWSATGGTVTTEGLFTAGDTGGLFAVRAKVEAVEAIGEVRVSTQEEPLPQRPPGKQMIRWHGDVPPQKWMNFYTKVLSRFASSPELKLSVRFEVPAEDEQARAKADEARTGLRELGLDDDVELQ